MNKLYLLVLLFALLGCDQITLQPFTPGAPLDNKQQETRLKQLWAAQYPENFLISHRFIVERDGHENALTGHLLFSSPGDIKAVATTDIGGVIFKINAPKERSASILKNFSGWSRNIMLNCVLRDIKMIYRNPFIEKGRLAKRDNGDLSLIQVYINSHHELIFDQHTMRPKKIVASLAGNTVYEMTFSSYEKLAGWPKSIPTQIHIKDFQWDYEVTVINNKIELR
jgi:hypothetical protein